ncbi:MAG: hypothetical protein ACRDZP_08655 [Acidimicrobiales bacterium]
MPFDTDFGPCEFLGSGWVVVVQDVHDDIAGAVGGREAACPFLRVVLEPHLVACAEADHGHVEVEDISVTLDLDVVTVDAQADERTPFGLLSVLAYRCQDLQFDHVVSFVRFIDILVLPLELTA